MTLGKMRKLGAAKLWPDATTPFRRDQPAASNQPSYGTTNDRKARSTRKPRGNYISLGDLLRWGRSSPSEASSVQFRPGTRCIRRAESKIKARLANLGGTTLAMSPDRFARFIADETEKLIDAICHLSEGKGLIPR
jgi:hypothetical protein